MNRFFAATVLLASVSLSSMKAHAIPDIGSISDDTFRKMNETSQSLFKRHRVASDKMIACYRKAMRGDKQASLHTFIIAVSHAFSVDYQDAVQSQVDRGISLAEATRRVDEAIVQSDKAMGNYKYLAHAEQSFKYCQTILDSNPEEAAAIEEIIKNMRKNE